MSVGQEEQEQEQEEGGEEEEERGGSDTYEPCQLGLYFVHLLASLGCTLFICVQFCTLSEFLYVHKHARAHTHATHTRPIPIFLHVVTYFFKVLL